MNNQTQGKRPHIDAILNFLSEIEIEYCIEESVKGSFAENIEIRNGVIHLDYSKVEVVDLLHESGHMALVLKECRHLFSGNLNKGFKQYISKINEMTEGGLFGTDTKLNILMCCEDSEVTAWAWAVGVKLELPHHEIITDDSYDGHGSFIRDHLALSHKNSMPYVGVAKLHHATYTKRYSRMIEEHMPESQFYPHMNYWTADAALSANNCKI